MSSIHKTSDKIDCSKPREVYESRRLSQQKRQQVLEVKDRYYATVRGVVGVLVLVMAWQVFADESLDLKWLIPPVAVFVSLLVCHTRLLKKLQRTKNSLKYNAQRLDHMAGNWAGRGCDGSRYCDADHAYSADLDIFGESSLFEMLCAARTRLGEDKLAQWLKSSADVSTLNARQQAIEAMQCQVEFREQLALLESKAREGFDQKQLQVWLNAESNPISRWQHIVASVLGIGAALSILAWMAGFGLAPLLLILVLEILFYAVYFRSIRRSADAAFAARTGLDMLVKVLALVEQHEFESTLLRQLCGQLQTDGHTASWQVQRLRTLTQLLNNCLYNQLISPLAFMLGVPIFVMQRVEVWREQVGPDIPLWFDAVAQIEALNSLARYAFENPTYPFPELLCESQGPCFDAAEMGHPLLRADTCVRNNLCVDTQQRLLMVSGSNMSGKSTLLRTVGINMVLAFSGAPVCAKSVKTSLFLIGTAMRANDSLQQGASLFYAVISRIKMVIDLSGHSPPLMFLLDEILQGTNSHDRRVGAEGIITQLLKNDAVGLVTTHDLALTEIVDSIGSIANNIHFEDSLVDGQMHFDYQIHSGVVKRSNALALMRLIGIDLHGLDLVEREVK